VLFRLGRRAIGMVTGFFALLGFIAVPIGERTGYEHVKSALGTPEGREAVAAVARAYEATRDRSLSWLAERIGRATAVGTGAATKTLAPTDLIGGRASDALDGERTHPGIRRAIVGHDEESRTVSRRGSREDTRVERGLEL
jgi:hypothetical protein